MCPAFHHSIVGFYVIPGGTLVGRRSPQARDFLRAHICRAPLRTWRIHRGVRSCEEDAAPKDACATLLQEPGHAVGIHPRGTHPRRGTRQGPAGVRTSACDEKLLGVPTSDTRNSRKTAPGPRSSSRGLIWTTGRKQTFWTSVRGQKLPKQSGQTCASQPSRHPRAARQSPLSLR